MLISVNPYRQIDGMYGAKALSIPNAQVSNEGDPLGVFSSTPLRCSAAGGDDPHVFSLADAAFSSMRRAAIRVGGDASASMNIHEKSFGRGSVGHAHSKADQSILVSGESGSGKTEACKRKLTYRSLPRRLSALYVLCVRECVN